MKMNNQDLQRTMQLLRNVAEVDPNDTVSNCASQLAYELETVRAPFDTDTLNEKRQLLIKYAISKRNTYVLKPGAKHACIVS